MRPPGARKDWSVPFRELERLEWRNGDAAEPEHLLAQLLAEHGLDGPPATAVGERGVVLLAGAEACARLAGLPAGSPSPVPAVPDLVAVVVERTSRQPGRPMPPGGAVAWRTTWTDGEHAVAVEQVRQVIARGGVYQANVV